MIIVIGAGVAGLAATRELTKRGIQVLLIEAQDRLGGRIKTIHQKNTYDLGASWIHDTLVNPLFPLAIQQNWDLEYDDAQLAPFTHLGKVRENVFGVRNDVFDSIELDYGLGSHRKKDVVLREYATDLCERLPLLSKRERLLGSRAAQRMEFWHGQSWNEIPASMAEVGFSGRNIYVRGGYDQLVKWLCSEIDWANVRLLKSSPVERISLEGQEVVVGLRNKTTEKGTRCVCTIPFGALQATFRTLFDFPLPSDLEKALVNGKMAALGKVFFEFDHQFWDSEPDHIAFLVDQPVSDPPMEPGNFPVEFLNVFRNKKDPYVLGALIAPPLTQHLEHNPDKAFEFLLPALEGIRLDRDRAVPEPSATYVSDWTVNEFFLGSYTGVSMGQTFDELVSPFTKCSGPVLFAGEHCAFDGNGCVHGAYLSGCRAGEEVLEGLRE